MRVSVLVASLFSFVVLAQPDAPRVVVQPVTTTVPLATNVNPALLTALAGLTIVLPSTFEVEDALAALPTRTCEMDERCLAGLARATRSGWAVAVSYWEGDKVAVLGAKVVTADGAVVRTVEAFPLEVTPTTDEQWLVVFKALTTKLNLEKLNEVQAVTQAGPVKKADQSTAQPAPAPVPLIPTRVAASSTWQAPVAVVAGLIAVGAGGAATALALTNVREASALETAKREGLIPGNAVDRAVAIDERTIAAAALGAGAGVAAVVAVVALISRDAPRSVQVVQVVPSVSSSGAGVILTGRFP